MKIALIENKSDEFYNSRLRFALFLQEKGHNVIAILPDDEFKEDIQNAGLPVITLGFDVRHRNISTVWAYIKKLKTIFKRENFDIIHFYRLQPNLIGTPTAFFSKKRSKRFNHITGLGVAFAQDSFKYKILRWITKQGYSLNYGAFKTQLILQNREDKAELGDKSNFQIVKGSAVNEDKFHPQVQVPPELETELCRDHKVHGGLTLLFVSRLVKIKGLEYLVEAVKQYNQKTTRPLNLLIAGWIDTRNPDSFSRAEIEHFSQIEGVHFLGKRCDVHELLAFSDIAVLPTFYREGTPRFLLEAMAMAKPIITTDMPGCNHLIPEGKNGKLIEPKNVSAIIEALHWFESKNLVRMGRAGYALYKQEFSEAVVYKRLLQIYKQ